MRNLVRHSREKRVLGSVGISTQPDPCAGKPLAANQALGELVKTRDDMPMMLDLVARKLDQVPFTVQLVVDLARLPLPLARWDYPPAATQMDRQPLG
jgi:hypothetical protein